MRKAALMGLGLVALVREKAEEMGEKLWRKGEETSGGLKELLSSLQQKGEEESKRLKELAQAFVQKAHPGLATRTELEELRRKVERLERRRQEG